MTYTTTFSAFGEAMLASVRAHFGSRVASYGLWQPQMWNGDPEPRINTPALMLWFRSASVPTAAYPPGMVAWRVNCSVFCLLSRETQNVQAEIFEIASAVGGLVSAWNSPPIAPAAVGQRWGLGEAVEPPERDQLAINPVDLGIPGLVAVSVDWSQTIYTNELLEP